MDCAIYAIFALVAVLSSVRSGSGSYCWRVKTEPMDYANEIVVAPLVTRIDVLYQ